MSKCPNCSHENAEDTQICIVCGTLLIEPTTSTKYYDNTDYEDGTPKWGTARFNGAMHLVFSVEDADKSFIFDLNEIDETTKIVMGRKDPVTGKAPEIDLDGVDGTNKGVSRNHAKVILQKGALHVVDNNSSNGTYLNGQKLPAQQPRMIRDGDDIRLGLLTMNVLFKRDEQN